MKIIDIDALFDKYISNYVYSNIGKVKPEEIENKIPDLYVKFGDEKLKELDGKTPNSYYRGFSGEELVKTLARHVEEGVAVSDFLCEAITADKKNEDAVCSAIRQNADEELIVYLMNMLGQMQSKKAKDKYLEFILWDYSEGIRELATELLCDMADDVKEAILLEIDGVSEQKRVNLVEILSHCQKDDRVFNLLVDEFVSHPADLQIYAGYLSKFGDERALPVLMEAIEREKISYADFEELRFAIEALGGQYNKERDFSNEKTYKKIFEKQKEQKQ
ncbi:MAG: hypothetical protein IJC07_04425 [Clostridia bacterium]|nr:hypothetical protein [Clostridia bacterium]